MFHQPSKETIIDINQRLRFMFLNMHGCFCVFACNQRAANKNVYISHFERYVDPSVYMMGGEL